MILKDVIEVIFKVHPIIKELIADDYSIVTAEVGNGYDDLKVIDESDYLDNIWVGIRWSNYIFDIGCFHDNEYSSYVGEKKVEEEVMFRFEDVIPSVLKDGKRMSPGNFELMVKLKLFLDE